MKAPVVDFSIAIAWVMADEESIRPEPVLDVVKEAGGAALVAGVTVLPQHG